MSNMSYCRFRNTLPDLRDCYDNMDDVINLEELRARVNLVKLCIEIADNYGDSVTLFEHEARARHKTREG